jgi:hypothetical protein
MSSTREPRSCCTDGRDAELGRECARCRVWKPEGAFRKDGTKKDGLYPACRVCTGFKPFVVIQWRRCPSCRMMFEAKRHNKGVYVVYCSRHCADAVKLGQRLVGVPTYHGAHQRTTKARGAAKGHLCACGNQAKQWALNHQRCAHPLESSWGPYSSEPGDYDPMCVPCHKRMDLDRLTALIP